MVLPIFKTDILLHYWVWVKALCFCLILQPSLSSELAPLPLGVLVIICTMQSPLHLRQAYLMSTVLTHKYCHVCGGCITNKMGFGFDRIYWIFIQLAATGHTLLSDTLSSSNWTLHRNYFDFHLNSVKVKVILRLTISQSVSLGIEHPPGAHDQIFVLWGALSDERMGVFLLLASHYIAQHRKHMLPSNGYMWIHTENTS
jgi:hypothetical protein